MDDVAGIDEPQPGAAGDRRDDAGIGQHRLGVFDRALIRLHLRLELGHQRLLGVVLLAARRVRRGQLGVAVEVDAGVAEQSFVHRLLGDCLVELGAIDGRVDVGENEPLLDVLAFPEIHRDQLAVDLGAHGHDVECAARPHAVEVDRDVLFCCGGSKHRHGGVSIVAVPAGCGFCRALPGARQVLRGVAVNAAADEREEDEEPDNAAHPSSLAHRGRGGQWVDAFDLHAGSVSLWGRRAASRTAMSVTGRLALGGVRMRGLLPMKANTSP
jgi:hypothetical protein